ncbi:S1/P1 nuclease [Sphingomonas sp.]
MFRTLALFAAALSLLVHAPAHAYGFFAHEAVAKIAMLNVRPETARAVRAMLARGSLLGTPDCRLRTPEDASTWPDCIRGMGERFAYTAPWHYQNVDICRPFDLKAACANGNCVSAQIDRQVRLLQNRTVPEREKIAALAFLIHFVGDLHTPPHAGDRGDRGGNDVKAAYGDYVAPWVNLHSIWDSPLAERAITTPPAIVRAYSPAERAELGAGTTEDWSREGWQVSRDIVYTLALGGNPCGPRPEGRIVYTNEAIEQAIAPQRLQVQRAGVRLARLLDEAFDPTRAYTPEPRRRRD